MGLKSSGGGEIVQVEGGHIIRATGRKDRHSKVFTAKGPRDRRVRLSAHTAIQFYDVQDRLGYDRPSKAVDWLIKKAKASIDKLAQLPPWDPSSIVDPQHNHNQNKNQNQTHLGSTEIHVTDHTGPSSFQQHQMNTFFPSTTISEENQEINFPNYPQSQDLCLSLHTSLQDSGPNINDQTSSLGFDIGWSEPQNHQDLGRFTRLMGWSGSSVAGDQAAAGRGSILFNPSPMAYNFQRGTLQSSFSPLLEQHQHQHHIHSSNPGFEGFMGFPIPSQIHGGASMSNTASSSSLSPDSSQR